MKMEDAKTHIKPFKTGHKLFGSFFFASNAKK